MKKLRHGQPRWAGRSFIKLLVMTKLTILLICAVSFQSLANGYSQKINFKADKKGLKQVLKVIEEQTPFRFVYKDDLLSDEFFVSATFKNSDIDAVLDKILLQTNLTYRQVNDNLFVIVERLNAGDQPPPPPVSIKGTVQNEKGEALSGASVTIKGTTRGVSTNDAGQFDITAAQTDILVVTSIGYDVKEIPVGNQTAITVSLLQKNAEMEQLVIVGYGSKKKVNLTGSVSSVSGDDLAKSPVASLSNTLAGSMPGLIVNTRSGEPGGDQASVFIRGIGTLGNSSPLIVIDGIPDRQGGFDRIDPNDIASFTVLKDASGAIYGARAANGVILITTKRGISGKPSLSFNTNVSATQATRVPKMLNSYQYGVSANEYNALIGQGPQYTDEQLQKYKDGSDPLGYPSTNWWDAVINPWAFQNNNVISLRGGSDKVKYFVSGQYLRQNSIYVGGADNNYYTNKNARANIDITATENFKIGVDVLYRNEYKLNSNGAGFGSIWESYPFLVPRYPNGLVGVGIDGGSGSAGGGGGSQVYSLSGDFGNTANTYDFLQTKSSFSWNLPQITKGLHLDGYYAYDLSTHNYKAFTKTPPASYSYNINTGDFDRYTSSIPPTLNLANSKVVDQLMNIKLAYERKFGKHGFEAFVAYEQSQQTYTEIDAYRTGFLSNNVPELFAGSTIGQTNNSVTTKTARQNLISRLSYNYDDKYLIDVNMRRDGSPNFPQGKRFGFFPAVSAAWRISNESFFQSGIIDDLKIRGSWGKTGNDAVPPFQYIQTYRLQAGQVSYYLASGYFFGSDATQVPGFVLGPTPNVNITWEVATSSNIGLDMRLFRALTVSIDVFRSMRTNILIPPTAVVPQYTGQTLPYENLGKVLNRGIELGLGYRGGSTKKFSYFINGNFTYAANKVVYFAEAASVPDYQKATGHPTSSWLIYQAEGLYQNAEEVTKSAHPLGSGPGDIKYKDVNGDGQINSLDQVRTMQSAMPQIMYGTTFGGRYKNIDVTIFFQGQAKAQAMLQPSGLNMAEQFYTGRWLKEGDNQYPRTFNGPTSRTFGSNTYGSTFWLLNDDFLRLKNVEIGYNFSKELLGRIKMQAARLYISGNNLFSIDKWGPSFDPEAPSGPSTNGRYYPQQRVLNLGLVVTF
jgi:TonB-linked SusC/RagA family outer membrane protein